MPEKYIKDEPYTFYMDLQIYLSTLLNLIDKLGAGALEMHDIIKLNRTIKADEVRNFFILMEVYGANCSTDNENFFMNSGIDDIVETGTQTSRNKSVLSQTRLTSLSHLTAITSVIEQTQ